MNVVTISSEQGNELNVNGLRFSADVLGYLAPKSGEWKGPLWIRRSGDVAEISTVQPASEDGYIAGFKTGEGA